MPVGVLDRVTTTVLGTAVAANAAANSTALTVEWTGEFADTGSLLLNGVVQGYTRSSDAILRETVLNLTTPLAAAAAVGDDVLALDVNGQRQQITEAFVRLDEGEEPMPYRVHSDLEGRITEATPYGTTVVVDLAADQVVGLDTVAAPLEAQAVEAPVEAPETSPTPSCHAGPGSCMVTWLPPASPYTVVDVHVSAGDPNGDAPATGPDASTLLAPDAKPVALVQTLADGTTLSANQQVYVALVARNGSSEAPPSPWVPGMPAAVPPELLEVAVGSLIANSVITLALQAAGIQIGNGRWDSDALDIPGVLSIPFKPDSEGNPPVAQMKVALNAIRATIANLRLSGQNNFVDGGIDLAAGVSKPSTAPPTPVIDFDSGNTNQQLEPGTLSQRATIGTSVCIDGGFLYFTDYADNKSNVWRVNLTTGVLDTVVKPNLSGNAVGGVTKSGSFFYVMSTRSFDGALQVDQYDTNWAFTGVGWLWQFTTDNKGQTPVMAPSSDGHLWIARMAGPASNQSFNRIILRKVHSNSGNLLQSPATTLNIGNSGISAGSGLYVGMADQDVERAYFVTSSQMLMYAMPTAAGAVSADTVRDWDYFRGSSGVKKGLVFDSGRFQAIDVTTDQLVRFGKRKADETAPLAYSWYDSDPTSPPGVDPAGTHETEPGPARTVTLLARMWYRFEADPPADTGQPDDPDSVRFYLNGKLQSDAVKGGPSIRYNEQTDTTLGDAPTTNGFATIAGNIGELRSLGRTGAMSSILMQGTGMWFLDPFKNLGRSTVTPLLSGGWVNYGNGWAEAAATLSDGRVQLVGLTIPPNATSNSTIFTLPEGFRPPSRRLFPAAVGGVNTATANSHVHTLSHTAGRIDVYANGEVRAWWPGNARPDYVSLDSVNFEVA